MRIVDVTTTHLHAPDWPANQDATIRHPVAGRAALFVHVKTDEGIEGLGVCAPGKTERPPADRVKTDKRDAIRLARLLAAGELTLVTIPSVQREQLRDLVRCREDIRVDLMRARNRIGKFLLRREIYWEGRGETRGSDACAGSTRSPRLGCVPRSANGSASIIPTSWPPTSGSSPQSTPAVSNAGSDRSPRPAPRTPGGCWSRRPGTTAAAPRSARRSSAASAAKHPRSSTSPGARNDASTPAGASSKTRAINQAGSSRSRSPANWPATAGRSPPGHPIPTAFRRHPWSDVDYV